MDLIVYVIPGIALGLLVISIADHYEQKVAARKSDLRKQQKHRDLSFLEQQKRSLKKVLNSQKVEAYHFLIENLIKIERVDLELMKSMNESFHRLLFKDKEAPPKFKINYPEGLDLKFTVPQAFYIGQFLIESAHNAIKHSSADFYIHLVTYENGLISIVCHDNGIGYDSATVHGGEGLIRMRMSAEFLNCKLVTSSVHGVGTKIFLECTT